MRCRSLYFITYLIIGLGVAGCGASMASQPMSELQQPTHDPDVLYLANGSWAPYNGADLPHDGCDSWIVQETFALDGIKVSYGFFPWARSYRLSASGEWDGTLTWDDTPEHRAEHYISAEPLSVQEWVFFYRSDRPLEWQTLDDLAGKTIGLTTGYAYSDAFKDLQEKEMARFIESFSDESNFKMLLAGRIDVFPMERKVGRYIMNSIFTPEERARIGESEQSFSEFKSYLLLSKAVGKNAELMELFNRNFKELQDNGRYNEIVQNCSR